MRGHGNAEPLKWQPWPPQPNPPHCIPLFRAAVCAKTLTWRSPRHSRILSKTPHPTSCPPGHCQHCVVSTSFWSNMPRASLNASTASKPAFQREFVMGGGWNAIRVEGIAWVRGAKSCFFIMHITTKAAAFLCRKQKLSTGDTN